MSKEYGQAKAPSNEQPLSPWETALNKLRQWDPEWAERCVQMTTNPWTDGILPIKFIAIHKKATGAQLRRPNLLICGKLESMLIEVAMWSEN